MEYLFFVAYLVLFTWLVTKTRFFLATGLSKPQLAIVFLLKIIAGIFYGWMGIYYGGTAQMMDTWGYHQNGIIEYHILGQNPQEYFTNLFHNPYEKGISNFFGSSESYWNDLKSNIFIKLLSVFDIFSFGHYYINVIFYTFLAFFGPVALYRVMKELFPGRNTLVLIGVFFIPSFFYWTSGIQKEGLIFLAISMIIYSIYFANKEKKYSFKRWIGIAGGLLLLLVLRNFVIAIILPAILAWLIAYRWPRRSLLAFAGVYFFFCLLFFTLRYISPGLDFPQAVVDKQKSFVQIVGNTSIPIRELEPSVASFIINTPQAITLSAIRPYPSDIKHLLSLVASIEIVLSILLLGCFLAARKKEKQPTDAVLYFCFFFSLSLLLAIGFSVNNLGAIVRYRSIIFPLLLTPLIAGTDWKKIFSLFSGAARKRIPEA